MNPNKLTGFAYGELYQARLGDHQADGVAFMAREPKTLCADPTGAGKTIMAAGQLAHLADMRVITALTPAVFLTDGRQLADETSRELSRFLPELTITGPSDRSGIDSQKGERRASAVNLPGHVHVFDYDQWHHRGHLFALPVPVVILDEVGALKGGKARYGSVLALTRLAERVHAFSATPYENNPDDLWHVYSLLNLPTWPSLDQFRHNYVHVTWHQGQPRGTEWTSWAAAEFVWDYWASRHTFRRMWATDALSVPELVKIPDWWVPLQPGQLAAMAVADKNLGITRGHRQRKVIYGAPAVRSLGAAEIIAKLHEQDRGTKFLVIGSSLSELDQLAAELVQRGISYAAMRGETKKPDRADVVHQFRTDPSLTVLLATKVAERGLNLQCCRVLISLGLPDNPARLAQQVGRIVRHGSPYAQVEHYVVLAECEHDKAAANRIMAKEAQAAMFLPDDHLPTPDMVIDRWWENEAA